ncbi:MAG: glycoside hydrolase family 57 protein [Chromatiales bacterium]|nr:glycoside hydrolase family 57 protein [Chromatiales bacterium]
MSVDKPLKVVFCWHMHQPDYRGPEHSDFQLPWVYLHAIKDYVDMAAHLERYPKAKAVVNFAPVLLEQLDDYADQIKGWLEQGTIIKDPLLAALAGPGVPVDHESRQALIFACRKANEEHLVNRFRPFKHLIELSHGIDQHKKNIIYFNDQFIVDLLVWYHLAWMGEFARINDIRIKSLEKKRKNYNVDDRRCLVEAIGDLISGVISRYRKLAEAGQVELSVTPFAHPIMPLLLDIDSTKEALPNVELPEQTDYPGGEPRARWHIREGIEVFEQHFGFRPQGCWPSEGAVSAETLRLLEEEGFRWAASGQQVLHNSLRASNSDHMPHNWIHRPYRLQQGKLSCFFRDDGLSDLIGFTYANWHADDAVANLVQNLENIDAATKGMPDRMVAIIMDGENAWEYYPRNGCFFFDALYKRLTEHPDIEMSTFSDCLDHAGAARETLSTMISGSWVYGTFSTWIGDPDKNRGWDMLIEAKQVYDRVIASNRLDEQARREAELQLARCEGSDWFWWFGDYNPGETVSDFEKLFRSQLTQLYLLLEEDPPEYLLHVFATGKGDPTHGGVMRQNV